MSAGLPTSKQIFIHGFIMSGGQRMSKTLGNVIDPLSVANEHGIDALRYFLARHTNPFEDSDFTIKRFEEAYTANLTNGLGNLVARVMKLAETHLEAPIPRPKESPFLQEYWDMLNAFEFNRAVDLVWGRIQALDERITREEPFKLIKKDVEKGRALITELVTELYQIGRLLNPFMPATSETIKKVVLQNKKPDNLFPRL